MKTEIISHIGEHFQEYTKYQYFIEPSRLSTGAPIPSPEKPVEEKADILPLSNGDHILAERNPSLSTIIKNRRSQRNFKTNAITTEELSALLWATQGVIESGRGYSLRTAPSAGARHPLETYLNCVQVDGIAEGLYRYQPLMNKLVQLSTGSVIKQLLTSAGLGQHMFNRCAVSFIWTAVIERSRWKYQQRAFRYIYLDAGHVCQNLYLSSEALGLGCCAVAAFDDDAVNEIVGVDGKEEFAIYMATVGKI